MTVFFESHQITIRRLKQRSGYNQSYSATYTAYGADVQPIEGQRINEVGGRIGKTYEAWIDPEIDVREGDQIDSGGVRYSVKAITYYHGAGLLDHKHLILESTGNVG